MAQDYNRLLKVRDSATGQVATFNITLAGLYLFAKFLAKDKTTEGVCRTLDYINYYDRGDILRFTGFTRIMFDTLLRYFRMQRGIYLGYRSWDRDDYMHYYELVNMHVPADDTRAPKYDEDLVILNGEYFTKDFAKKYTKHCETCHKVYFDQVSLIDAGYRGLARRIARTGLLGYGDVCGEHCNMNKCSECGLFVEDYETVDGQIYCPNCFENLFVACSHCGRIVSRDSRFGIYASNGNFFCDADCAQSAGYHYDEDECEWTNRAPRIIGRYHNHKGKLDAVITKKDRRIKQTLLIGCETEVDSDEVDQNTFDSSWYDDLLKKFGNYVCFENDGSLNNGFEIITSPMSEKDFMAFDWETPYKKLRNAGWGADEEDTTGKHFHYSMGYLGYNVREIKNNAKKVCRFFQLYWDDIAKISRRNDFDYCYDWGDRVIGQDTSFEVLADDRYHAVNLTNMYGDEDGEPIGTIEIRICKGTINAKTTLASADFFLHIVRNAKRIAWKNIGNLKLWFKGITNQNTIDYIKSRNAFVGMF